MERDTATMERQGATGSPVDNETYNLLQALTSSLEAIEAYGKYTQDGGEGGRLFQQLAEEEKRHAEQLLEVLKRRLGS